MQDFELQAIWSRDLKALQAVAACNQCGRCTAACPVESEMEHPPARLVRILQLGALTEAAETPGIWRCIACGHCRRLCPQGVSVREIIGCLRRLAFHRGNEVFARVTTLAREMNRFLQH
ncbi:MAG: 4Fe-4S dicluster domain-containing protein [Thermoanaerobacterales bacterium]|nr:4Fe-4S dicluster domain-containing protein [Thermoanaerobacterales bacterium]